MAVQLDLLEEVLLLVVDLKGLASWNHKSRCHKAWYMRSFKWFSSKPQKRNLST